MMVMQVHPTPEADTGPLRKPRNASTNASPSKQRKQPTRQPQQQADVDPQEANAENAAAAAPKGGLLPNKVSQTHSASPSPGHSNQSVASSPLVDPVAMAFTHGTDQNLAQWVGKQLLDVQQQQTNNNSKPSGSKADPMAISIARAAFLDEMRMIVQQSVGVDDEDLQKAGQILATTAQPFPSGYQGPPNIEASAVHRYPPNAKSSKPPHGTPASTRIRLNLPPGLNLPKSRGGSYLMDPMPAFVPPRGIHAASGSGNAGQQQQQQQQQTVRYPRRSSRGRNKKKDDLYVPLDSDDDEHESGGGNDDNDSGMGSDGDEDVHIHHQGGTASTKKSYPLNSSATGRNSQHGGTQKQQGNNKQGSGSEVGFLASMCGNNNQQRGNNYGSKRNSSSYLESDVTITAPGISPGRHNKKQHHKGGAFC